MVWLVWWFECTKRNLWCMVWNLAAVFGVGNPRTPLPWRWRLWGPEMAFTVTPQSKPFHMYSLPPPKPTQEWWALWEKRKWIIFGTGFCETRKLVILMWVSIIKKKATFNKLAKSHKIGVRNLGDQILTHHSLILDPPLQSLQQGFRGFNEILDACTLWAELHLPKQAICQMEKKFLEVF